MISTPMKHLMRLVCTDAGWIADHGTRTDGYTDWYVISPTWMMKLVGRDSVSGTKLMERKSIVPRTGRWILSEPKMEVFGKLQSPRTRKGNVHLQVRRDWRLRDGT